jgi:hypothetical protein
MTRKEKVNYFRIACNLQRIGVNERTADQIIETYETVMKLGGDFSLKNAVDIEVSIERKYKEKELKKKA